jgi:hypothetical protein
MDTIPETQVVELEASNARMTADLRSMSAMFEQVCDKGSHVTLSIESLFQNLSIA